MKQEITLVSDDGTQVRYLPYLKLSKHAYLVNESVLVLFRNGRQKIYAVTDNLSHYNSTYVRKVSEAIEVLHAAEMKQTES